MDRQLNCLDAEWQDWETRLTETYNGLKAIEEERGAEAAEALVTMERGWIAFRDARCAYEQITNSDDPAVEAMCKLNETARQVILLMAYHQEAQHLLRNIHALPQSNASGTEHKVSPRNGSMPSFLTEKKGSTTYGEARNPNHSARQANRNGSRIELSFI